MKKGPLVMTALLLTACAAGAEVYVSPAGSDENSGTQAAPFATIQKAASLMKAGDTCIVRGGTYHETVTPAASGEPDKPITFRAAEGETVTVSGAEAVTGWAKHQGAVWRAQLNWDLGKNNQVFFDGKRLPEARWPNKMNDELLDPEGAKIDGGDEAGLVCKALPDGDWIGAAVWALCHSKWTSWSATVTGYDAAQKKLLFALPEHVLRFHNPGEGGEFYLVGKLALLDAPGEWFFDPPTKTLYLWPPEGADPNTHAVTAKRRLLAFDLQGRAHVQVVGINVHAATLDLRNARHCVVQGVRATYVSHTRGGDTSYGLGEPTGITVSGTGNVIRDSELACSVGDGILLGGDHNAVINCWLHDLDYFGCYGTPVKIAGTANMLSHSTIHDTGRDCIQVSGQAHLVQYNHVYNAGRICHDLGFLYTCANDGGGTEIRYNHCHDNLAPGTRCGLYLDNFTSNYLVHHNVVWNTNGEEIRLNKPSQYNLVYNNTVMGNLGNWGRWKSDRMFGDRVQNNLLGGKIAPHPDLFLANNEERIPPEKLNRDSFSAETRPGLAAGAVVPGITDGFAGAGPDLGAYQAGTPQWTTGHDFGNPPNPEYRLSETPYRNRVVNGSLDWPSPKGEIAGWARIEAGTAKLIRGQSGITENQDERDSFIGQAVCLSGPDDDGIEQVVAGLAPNTRYVVAGWLKAKDAGAIRLGVRGHAGSETSIESDGRTWEHIEVNFTTGATNTTATVFVVKGGSGAAFADDVGLVLAPVPAE
ncbi:MAG: hypothetical protein COZ06_33155 [Armatimonadetes bacterium CG_4_10_14_3_um_filter_66_18]|nr:MAG: hypothetical protein COZ06_33155 [Armatimonadetes bacterium CG_4_10_14_3_um_filter_66_18]